MANSKKKQVGTEYIGVDENIAENDKDTKTLVKEWVETNNNNPRNND